MGMPIIGHLVRKGFTVLVHDVDPAKESAVVERGAAGGFRRVSAGNYGGKLGPFHLHLHKLLAEA